MGKLRALAACGVNLRTIADYFGVDRKTLIQKVDDDENLRKIYRAGQADLKETILSKAIEQVNKGNTAMIIFLMKALCGLTEKGDREDEARERAATIREMVDRLDEGKGRFKVGPDGMIIDPLATPPPPPKKKKGVKSRVVRRGKGKR